MWTIYFVSNENAISKVLRLSLANGSGAATDASVSSSLFTTRQLISADGEIYQWLLALGTEGDFHIPKH